MIVDYFFIQLLNQSGKECDAVVFDVTEAFNTVRPIPRTLVSKTNLHAFS